MSDYKTHEDVNDEIVSGKDNEDAKAVSNEASEDDGRGSEAASPQPIAGAPAGQFPQKIEDIDWVQHAAILVYLIDDLSSKRLANFGCFSQSACRRLHRISIAHSCID